MANTTYGSPYVQSSDLVSGWPATSLSVADRIDDVSFKGNGVNNQTATYTTVLTDAGKTIVMNVGSANDLTIQASGTAAYETGTIMRIINKGTGATTVKPAGGVTLNGGNITLAQNQSATIVNVAADIWSPIATPASSSGLTLITTSNFSAVSSVSINNCFTSDYANYRIITTAYGSAGGFLNLKLRASGTDASSDYYDQTGYAQSTSVGGERYGPKSTGAHIGYISTTSTTVNPSSMDIFAPALAVATQATSSWMYGSTAPTIIMAAMYHNNAAAYDGLTLLPDSGTITGNIRIFGYKNS